MTRLTGTGLAAATLLLLTACATGYRPTPYWTIKETSLYSLQPGVSTKEDVRRTIGVPISEVHFPHQNEGVWEYPYLEGTTIIMLASVHFDPNGRYKYMFRMLDPAYHSGFSNN